VDDAIVVVEAVEHNIEHGLTPREATIKAMEEVTTPVIGIALVLSSVFIPWPSWEALRPAKSQFAITIAVSVLISAFNALTLSPRSRPFCFVHGRNLRDLSASSSPGSIGGSEK